MIELIEENKEQIFQMVIGRAFHEILNSTPEEIDDVPDVYCDVDLTSEEAKRFAIAIGVLASKITQFLIKYQDPMGGEFVNVNETDKELN
jgi:hypothetical protein